MISLSFSELLIIIEKLALAAALGALIGLERDSKGRAAGLRTQILVSLGSALLMILSIHIVDITIYNSLPEALRTDPGRIAAQIITGIGFLGAGAIIKSGINVRGLTTASCIWVSSGVGMTCGMGYYEIAAIATTFAVFSLIFLNYFERYYSKDSWRELVVEVEYSEDIIDEVIKAVKEKDVLIHYCQYTKDFNTKTIRIILSIKLHEKGIVDKQSHRIIQNLESKITGLKKISWLQKKD
ncbi:MAG: MgtC/SapB family protein [Candidatus Coatesbacteria bacterium]|nr:MgtC/SapB family protein [Candidatus Coatesbacteria bacterium]